MGLRRDGLLREERLPGPRLYRHRSEFKGEVVSLFSNLGFPTIGPDNQMDAQVGYTFQPNSSLNGLGVVLQVSNVLNSPYRTYYNVNDVKTLETYEEYGRSFLLGGSYHFGFSRFSNCGRGSGSCRSAAPPPPRTAPEAGKRANF